MGERADERSMRGKESEDFAQLKNNAESKSDTEHGITEKNLSGFVKQMLQVLGRPDRLYKDQVFRMLLKNRKIALEVYNAINDSHYDNPDALQITTLENAVYLGMKNDVSFLIDSRLVLYEHQSTYNPNMPLRDLFYVACLFSALVYEKNIYGSKMIHLPSPQFVVFYNGIEELPERSIMRLSDAYEGVEDADDIALELKVQVININYGKNASLMEKSPTLAQYAIFVDTVRTYEKEYERTEALEKAIDECISRGVLADFLRKNKAEVLMLCLFEYDQEKHMKDTYEDGVEDGIGIGEKRGIEIGEKRGIEIGETRGEARGEKRGGELATQLANQLTQALLKDNRLEDLSRSTQDAEYRVQLLKEYKLM